MGCGYAEYVSGLFWPQRCPHLSTSSAPMRKWGMLTETEADQRIIKSRKVQSAIAQAFAAGDLTAPMHQYVAQIAAEIGILEGLAADHPGKADKIGNLIERYEVLARHMRERMD